MFIFYIALFSLILGYIGDLTSNDHKYEFDIPALNVDTFKEESINNSGLAPHHNKMIPGPNHLKAGAVCVGMFFLCLHGLAPTV